MMQHLHLTFADDQLFPQMAAFHEHLKAVAENVSVVEYGYCQKSGRAFLVLEWLDEVDENFLTQLDAESSFLDYCVYTVAGLLDDVPFSLTFADHDDDERIC